MDIRIKKLSETAQLPSRESAAAAGYDLYADLKEAVQIRPHATEMVRTGIALEIPEGYFGAVFARSGLAAREALRPSNCVGVIDADYRGELMVAMHNDGGETRMITPGERIAQLVILPFLSVTFTETETLGETARGARGFGSTGSH